MKRLTKVFLPFDIWNTLCKDKVESKSHFLSLKRNSAVFQTSEILRSAAMNHENLLKEVFVGVGRKLHKAIGLALIRTAISLDRRMDGFLSPQRTLAHTLSGGGLPVLELGPVWRGVVVARFAGEAGKIETGIGRVQAKVPHAMG